MVATLGPGQTLQAERMYSKPKVSQGRLATALGLNRTTLSFYETEERAPTEGWPKFSARYRAALALELRKARAK